MNIELNVDELNLIIESLSDTKSRIFDFIDFDSDLVDPIRVYYEAYYDSICTLKTKLCNYSLAFQEEN